MHYANYSRTCYGDHLHKTTTSLRRPFWIPPDANLTEFVLNKTTAVTRSSARSAVIWLDLYKETCNMIWPVQGDPFASKYFLWKHFLFVFWIYWIFFHKQFFSNLHGFNSYCSKLYLIFLKRSIPRPKHLPIVDRVHKYFTPLRTNENNSVYFLDIILLLVHRPHLFATVHRPPSVFHVRRESRVRVI